MDESTIRIVSGALAVVCVLLLILRRRAKQKTADRNDS